LDSQRAEVSRVVRRTAFQIEAQAKVLAPVDTGFMRNSIGTEMVSQLTAVISVGAEYGAYVEFGTTRMRAQPFLGPAVERNRAAFEAAIKALLS
jgi:HK97 gp10 family phage protein